MTKNTFLFDPIWFRLSDMSNTGHMHETLEESGALPMDDQGDGSGEGDDDLEWEEG